MAMSWSVAALEGIEHEAWRRLAAAAPPDFARGIGLDCEPMDGALFMMASRIPAFQFNWLSGAGLTGDNSAAVGRAVARFRESAQTKFIVQVPPSPRSEAIAAHARSEGLVEHPLSWAKFVRAAAEAPATESGVAVREVRADEADLFASTAVAGFGMPPPMSQWLRQIVGAPRWRCFVGAIDGVPVAAGALFLHGDYGWVGVGATQAEARKRGAHRALLARRIAEAARAGARWVVTETGIPLAGQDAPSYRNIVASGFQVAYVRPNWAEAG
jgi:hypothetical protein